MSGLLQRATLAYSEKRYDDVVHVLSEAQSLAKADPVTSTKILDLRCLAYAKLGKHDLALQDAKAMIHVGQRKKPEGYIRCSQIEKALRNYATAIKWLEHGAKNVPLHRTAFDDHKRRIQVLIQQEHADRRRQDPISTVPLEVIEQILSYLTYREVVSLLRVSKSWKNLMSSMKPLISTVDFTDAKKMISAQTCNAAFRRLRRGQQRIQLVRLSPSATKIVEVWLANPLNVKKLQVLHLMKTDVQLKSSWLQRCLTIHSLHVGGGQHLPFANFLLLIEMCQIKDAIFGDLVIGDLPNFRVSRQDWLQHLKIRNTIRHNEPPSLDFSIYPNLRSLILDGVHFPSYHLDLRHHQHLLKLHIRINKTLFLSLKLPKSLEDLVLDSADLPGGEFNLDDPLELPSLHTLFLAQCASNVLHQLRNDGSLHLDKIYLHVLSQSDMGDTESLIEERLFTVKDVHFASDGLRDLDAQRFADLFPAMERLTLDGAWKITGVFISDVVSRPASRLKQITMVDCGKVSPDICQWLKSKGIESRLVNNTINMVGGRRLRDDW